LVAQLIWLRPIASKRGVRTSGNAADATTQHVPYERQLEFKAEILRETLTADAKSN